MKKITLPSNCEADIFIGKVPYVKWEAGPKKIIVIESSGDLLRGLAKDPLGRVKMSQQMMVPKNYSFIDLGYHPDYPEGYTIEQTCADFAACIKQKYGPAPVISGSYGGLVAITFAALYPDLCEKLVLISSGYQISTWATNFLTKAIEKAKAGKMYEAEALGGGIAKRKIANLMMTLMMKMQKKKLLPLYNNPSVLIHAFTQVLSMPGATKKYLPQIKVPTLIVGGDQDQFFDLEIFEETTKLIPNATFKRFPGETHGLVFERSKELHQIIKDFLEK